jgi:EmrB/QacA subfamily drug resistance transporter
LGRIPLTTLSQSEIRTVIIGAMLAMFLSALDQTIVATALPPIARDLGDFALISWVITSYLLTSTCITPIVGKLSDLYGRRRILAMCLVGFMVGSACCALAPTMVALILARALQGLGGGGLIALAQTIVADVVSPRERGRYAAYFSMVWASSSVLGPTIGGIVTEHYGWPWIFWINLPLGLLALAVCDRALRKLPIDRHRSAIDYASIALLSGATIALLIVLSLGGKRLPWMAPQTLAIAVAAVILGGFFVRLQSRAAEPILPPRFLGDGVIRPVLAAGFIVYGSYLAVAVLAPIYFQVALGVPVSEAGLLMIPLMLSSTVTANMAGRWSRRTGRYKRPTMVGLPVAVVAMAVVALLAARLSAPLASAILMIAGFGIGPFFPCSTVAAQNAVERRDLGAVSGAVAFSRALGAALMIAAASTLVLGLAAGALPETGQVASIEDLARQALPPEARAAVGRAFGIMFGAVAIALAFGCAIFARVEDRILRDRPANAPAPAAD